MNRHAQGWGLLLVVLAAAVWSSSGIFISLVVSGSGISSVGLAFWRDIGTFACLLVGMLLFRPHLLKVNRRDLPWLAAMGISMGVFHVLWNTAVVLIGVSVATVMQSNAPIFVTLMAWLLWKEPLTRRKVAAIGLATIGTILISRLDSLGEERVTLVGLLVGLMMAVLYGALSLFGKKLTNDYSAWTVLTYVFAFATLVLSPFQIGAVLPQPIPPDVLVNYAALVLLPTVGGFGFYNMGLGRLQASVASIVATLEIAFAAMTSYVILGERLDGWQVLGALLVVSSVVLVSLPVSATRVRQHWLAG